MTELIGATNALPETEADLSATVLTLADANASLPEPAVLDADTCIYSGRQTHQKASCTRQALE